MPRIPPVLKDPSVSELLDMTEEDTQSVWDRFQYSISKREMYKDDPELINDVLTSMRELPIVGKSMEGSSVISHFD